MSGLFHLQTVRLESLDVMNSVQEVNITNIPTPRPRRRHRRMIKTEPVEMIKNVDNIKAETLTHDDQSDMVSVAMMAAMEDNDADPLNITVRLTYLIVGIFYPNLVSRLVKLFHVQEMTVLWSPQTPP